MPKSDPKDRLALRREIGDLCCFSFISDFREQLDALESAGLALGLTNIRVDKEQDAYSNHDRVFLVGYSEETDSEYSKRKREEKEFEQREREQLARLQAKYKE